MLNPTEVEIALKEIEIELQNARILENNKGGSDSDEVKIVKKKQGKKGKKGKKKKKGLKLRQRSQHTAPQTCVTPFACSLFSPLW